MKIKLADIHDGAEKAHVSENVKIKDVAYFADKRNRGRLEDLALKGMILSMKSGIIQQAQAKQASNSYNNQNTNKKPRIGTKPFNRYILVADLANPPHTFAITTSTLSETNRLLGNMFFDTFLGMSFYLVEPDNTRSALAGYTNILRCEEEELLPLKWNLKLDIPAPITVPPTSQEIYYFAVQNTKVELLRARVALQPCCRGYQCDRQKKTDCLCIHTASLSPITYDFDVELDVNPVDFQGEIKHVCKFRSNKLTRVFFKQFEDVTNQTVIKSERQNQQERRKQIKKMNQFINSNGAWTIVGWAKRGEIKVDGEAETIQNNIVNLRLSCLYPTDETIFNNDEFKSLQIDASNVNSSSINNSDTVRGLSEA